MKKKLSLMRETLTELTTDDLHGIVGGAESVSCPITYSCGCTATATLTSGGISNNCTNVSDNCTFLPGGC